MPTREHIQTMSYEIAQQHIPEQNKEQESREEVVDVLIGDKFWSLLMQRMGIPLNDRIENLKQVSVIFNSADAYFKKRSDSIQLAGGETEGVVLGGYFQDDEKIRFNAPMGVFREQAIPVIIHELIHYIQDLCDMFPDMRKLRKNQEIDRESPWEVQAYRLMYTLQRDFDKYCEVVHVDEDVQIDD
jgi:hypothetical protein